MTELDAIPTMTPRAYSGAFGIPMPPPDDLCEICGDRVGKPQRCTTDGAYHRHGMIHAHSRALRLTWTCDECRAADAREVTT